MAASCWKVINCPRAQLVLETVLVGGQSFRWKTNNLGEWLGVICGRVFRLKQTDQCLLYQVFGPCLQNEKSEAKHHVANAISKVKTFQSERVKKELCMAKVPLHDGLLSDTKGKMRGRKRKNENTVTASHRESLLVSNIKQEPDNEVLSHEGIENEEILKDYFQLNVDLENLYSHWSSKDPNFAKVGHQFPGIRILRQDPVENLISFVCSSNNHISRITSMVEKLCTHYGSFITQVDGQDYYSFPSFKALSGEAVETHLRELGFGYRAKYIASIAKHITQEKGEDWLFSLRDRKYPEAKAELMTLLGVGSKVADCVCLMSLDKAESVPVDTHVWQITLKNYMAKLQTAKSLTDKLYMEIGDFYRNLWGPYAGWAHSVLFIADLKQNKDKPNAELGSVNKVKTEDKPAKPRQRGKKAK